MVSRASVTCPICGRSAAQIIVGRIVRLTLVVAFGCLVYLVIRR